jgi:hypothetical protein
MSDCLYCAPDVLLLQVGLRLARRKTRPQGRGLRRSCWCQQCWRTCPVHAFWVFVEGIPVGSAPFAGVTGSAANEILKDCCSKL